MWRDRPVLVTGAAGLLGGWLVEALLDRHASVVCILRDETPLSRLEQEGLHKRVTTVRGDFCDQALVERVLGEYEIRTVVHLGAQAIVGVANRNPVSTFESNVRGTWVVMEGCRRSPLVEEVVLASSDKAYGDQPVLPYDEDTPLQGRNPYDASKSCADLIAQSYATTWGLPVVIARCGNLFGGGDPNWNRLVPGVIRDVLQGRPPLIRSDGRFVRDYIYVEDGADAYIRLVEALHADRALTGRAYNFSLEQPLSVLEMVEHIVATIGDTSMAPVVLNQASNEIREQFLSSARARSELGWRPSVGLDEGLRRTVEWYRRRLAS